MTDYKTAIVVGASSGIGRELAIQLASRGCRVGAIGRRRNKLEELQETAGDKILAYEHDVTDYDAVPALFQKITKELGGLDLIVYCSGVMPEVAPHEFNFAKDRAMFEVNVLGAMAWLNEAAVRFEGTKSGTIVAIGSVAGDRGRSGQPAYNASKAAIATYMEALRNRLCTSGVKVVTIKPGPVDTEMTANLHLKGAMPAEKAAALTLKLSEKTGEHYLKPVHRVIFYVIKRVPSPVFRRLKI